MSSIALNPALVSRFTAHDEDWKAICLRVAELVRGDTHLAARMLQSGKVVPAGQILRGAGNSDAVLFNSYIIGSTPSDTPYTLARRISAWTELGIGVGTNISDLSMRSDYSVGQISHIVGHSQQEIWDKGLRRTATMLSVDLSDEGVQKIASELSRFTHLRHLNLSVMLHDEILEKAFSDHNSTQYCQLKGLLEVALSTGNPGFVFASRVNREARRTPPVNACNACAELHLRPDEGAPLCSLNLPYFVKNGEFDFDEYEVAIDVAVRLLDAAIDVSAYPSPRAGELARSQRSIGLGVMGLDTALQRLGVRYDSEAGVSISLALAERLRDGAERASQRLASTLGPCTSLDGRPIDRRNSLLLAIAPTGGISSFWGVSSGIEPTIGRRVSKETITIDVETSDEARPQSHEIHWRWHLDHLAAWQRHVDGGISKTVTLPTTTTLEEAEEILVQAWMLDVKSLSIFRIGSRPGGATPNG